MKRFILFCLCFSAFVFAEEEKIYVEKDQVFISQKGIYVHFEEGCCPVAVKGLSSDEKGLYVYGAATSPCGHISVCSRCHGCVYSRSCSYGCRCFGY